MASLAKAMISGLCLAALAGCAPLTARHPLFEPSLTRPELVEGIWLSAGEACLNAHQQHERLPDDCLEVEIHRANTGYWLVRVPASGADGRSKDEAITIRGALAPAIERQRGADAAPLYLFERGEPEGSSLESIRYDAVIPIGDAPARALYLVVEIGCDDALRDGPIAGVSEHTNPETLRRECVAENPQAVRVAVRRAVIENLGDLENRRLVFVQE